MEMHRHLCCTSMSPYNLDERFKKLVMYNKQVGTIQLKLKPRKLPFYLS